MIGPTTPPQPSRAHRAQPCGRYARRRAVATRAAFLLSAAVALTLVVFLSAQADVAAQAEMALVRVVHASPDAPTLDVTAGSVRLAEAIAYGTAGDYVTVPADARLTVTPSGDTSRVLLDTPLALPPRAASTLVLAGLTTAEPALRVIVLSDDLGPTDAGRTRLRFLHASPGTPLVEFATPDVGSLASLAFGERGETVLNAGSYTLIARPSSGPPIEAALTAASTRSYTLILIGRSGSANPPRLLPIEHTTTTRAGASPLSGSPGTVLISETFADPATGILPAASAASSQLSYGYVDGEYFLRNLSVATLSLPLPGEYTDASIAVDARLIGDATERTVSVGCRFTSTPAGNRGYRLRVEPAAGRYRLVREDGDRDFFLRSDRPSSAIRRGTDTNRLELTCAGRTITAAINGTVVATVQDSTYTAGPLVIGVGARASGLTSEARFDNLTVTQH